jgi:excisionase family DNA binding protein
MLAICLRTLQKLIAAGDLRAIYIGSRSLIPKDELDRFIKKAAKQQWSGTAMERENPRLFPR